MITQTELASFRIKSNAPLSREEILKQLIDDDMKSAEYLKAVDGERYYSGEQDVKYIDFRKSKILDKQVGIDGQEADVEVEFSNPNRSNHRMQHRFSYLHIEQKVSYMSGKEPSVAVDGAKASEDGASGNDEWVYQGLLTNTTNARFRRVLLEWERQASIGGKSWLHEYKDRNGNLRQIVVPRTGGIAIYDTAHNKDIVEYIRHYPYTLNIAGKEYQGRKAEWWTGTDVTYYATDSKGNYRLDTDRQINPAPHYWEVTLTTGVDGVTLEETFREGRNWGKPPFIELNNNSQGMTDLEVVKDLIDAYDLVCSKGTNNLMDFNEFYAIIQGFGGDVASAVVKKLEVNRAVSVSASGSGNNIELKQLDLQMAGRIDWLKQIWDAIHYFGMAVDTTKESLGSAASGVALEFQYSLLDLKANNLIIEAEQALSEHFAYVTEDINRQMGTAYDSDLVNVTFSKTRPTNQLETVTMIRQSEGLVPEFTLLQAHPLVKDADEAYKQVLAERERTQARRMAILGNYGTDLPSGE